MLSPRTLARLSAVAVFLNTAPGPRGGTEQPERLTAGAQLTALVPALQEDEVRLRVAAAATARARELRGRLAEAWALAAVDEAAATDGVNALLAEVGPLRLVAGEDSVDFAPATTPADAVERLTALAALAMAEAAVDGELSRLRICAGEDCENALVDASRNRSKRFCDEANCANRTHVRSYRARQAEGPAAQEGLPAEAAVAADPAEAAAASGAAVVEVAVTAADHAEAAATELPATESGKAAKAPKEGKKKGKGKKGKDGRKAEGGKAKEKDGKKKKGKGKKGKDGTRDERSAQD